MVRNQFFPRKAQISGLTNASQAVATFTEDHDFIVGEIVSFRVTKDFGMFQINQKKGQVLSKTSDTITVDIDTSTWDPFDNSALNTEGTTPPFCVPCCSGVIQGDIPKTVIDDAFDNRRV